MNVSPMLQVGRGLLAMGLAAISLCVQAGANGPPLPFQQQARPGAVAVTAADRAALLAGESVEIIVEFEQSAAIQLANAMRANSGLPEDGDAILAARAAEYVRTKDLALGAMSVDGRLKLTRDYSHLPMVAIRASGPDAVERVLALPGVVAVFSNIIHVPILTESLPLIHQPEAAAQGATGAGTTVAVLDTGVDYTRAAFGLCSSPGGSCKVAYAQDFAPDDGSRDAHGHGTNVAGIVLGVAPGARIAALDVFTGGGAAVTDIVAAMNWSIANRATYNIVAMNMSLGDRQNNPTNCPSSWATTPIANARAAGIATVIASGNDNYKSGMAGPACAPGAISVGAVYDAPAGSPDFGICRDANTTADMVTCFSNSASFLTMLAPGSSIMAAGIPMSGTSQAAPHAAGAIAALRGSFPGESFDAAVSRLVSTGIPVTDVNGITKSRIDLLSAIAGGRPTLIVSKAGVGAGNVTSSPSGINCGATCSAAFNAGTLVTLIATPATGSTFGGWSGGGCSGAGTCVIAMSSSKSVTAIFNSGTIPLSVAKSGAGNGTVTSTPSGINCGNVCNASFNSGTVVSLNAAAAPGSTFDGWSGDCSGAGACTFTMSAARSVTATFSNTVQTFPLTVVTTGGGLGTVLSAPSGIECGTNCSANYAADTVVTLTALPAQGTTFAGWSGACTGTGSCLVTMNVARSVTATFLFSPASLTIAKSGGGLGVVTSTPGGISCGDNCSAGFNSGTFIGIQAIPVDASSIFAGWSGGGCAGTGPCALILTDRRTVTAVFEPAPTVTLTVAKNGTGAGGVSSSPPGIDCGASCSASYRNNSSVTLTATPGAGAVFAGWGGACSGNATCTVTMNAARSVTATFNAVVTQTFPLTVNVVGPVGATVTSSPMGIYCGGACVSNYTTGTQVLLTARAAPGLNFVGWSGICSGDAADCSVPMTAARTATATFRGVSTEPITLTVSRTGTGSGSVISAPEGISCGQICSKEYGWGTSVVLDPRPAANSTFVGWSGGPCSGSSGCSLTLTGSAGVSAVFALNAERPTVAPGSLSFGSQWLRTTSPTQRLIFTNPGLATLVFTSFSSTGDFGVASHNCTSVPAGGNCQVDMNFTPTAEGNRSGTLTAGWNGGTSTIPLSGVGAPAPQFTLTISKTGSGSGTVSSAPSGINCGPTCSASFDAGTVTLTASAASGSTFAGWSGGGCSGTGTCVVTMSAATAITAAFDSQTSSNPPRLANISTRMQVLTGDSVLIGGFIIGGSATKTIVVRARGPSLTALGVPGALANPVLNLYSGQTVIASNDDWQTASNATTIQSSGFAPSDALESAILMTLGPGAYTAIVSGAGGITGVGLIEVFEVDAYTVPLINIATRGQVQTGDSVMIGGFIIQGNGPQTVVVRARGPSLTAAGVPGALANPVLSLFSGQTVIASNDDWQTASNAATLQASGFAPSNAQESAILITLNPGAYTAIVSGAGGTTGVAIVEVFAVP